MRDEPASRSARRGDSRVSRFYRTYLKGIRSNYGHYHATWLPSEQREVGEVGVIEDYQFIHVTTLAEIGIPFESRLDEGRASIDIVSGSGTQVHSKLAGQTSPVMPSIPQIQAGVSITFGEEGGFILQSEETQHTALTRIPEIEESVKALATEGKWHVDWVVVSSVVTCPYATIIVAITENVEVEISVDVDGLPSASDLASVEANARVVAYRGESFRLVPGTGVTPMYRALGLRHRILRSPHLIVRNATPQLGRLIRSADDLRRDLSLLDDVVLIEIQPEEPNGP